MSRRLPLFPLGTVLFPGQLLPLQVFEPRYVQLLADVVAVDEHDFGVISIRHGHEVGQGRARDLAETGCVARVRALEKVTDLPSPVFAVVAVGTRRFALDGLDQTASRPYLTGLVTMLDDDEEEPDAATDELADRVRLEHAAYLTLLGADPVALPGEASEVAYAVGLAMALEPADRQQILDAWTSAARLRVALGLLRRERSLVGRFGAVPGVASPGGSSLN